MTFSELRTTERNLREYGLYSSALDDARTARSSGASPEEALRLLFYRPSGDRDALPLALLAGSDIARFSSAAAAILELDEDQVARFVESLLDEALTEDFLVTGAEAVALIVRSAGTSAAFAYAGTSELALCDALARVPGVVLVNGRGDAESAFMAAGASLLRPVNGVAVLHAARGVTNAAGAIADIRRNEVGMVGLVGLPSTTSAPFLPPHAEPHLMQTMGALAKWSYEASGVPQRESDRRDAASDFVTETKDAFLRARTLPHGPALLGVPQDVAEQAWVPWSLLHVDDLPDPERRVPTDQVRRAAEVVRQHHRVVVIVDDYLLKYEGAADAVADFARRVAAPVFQVRYRRGPMLFERLSKTDVPTFAGWLDPSDTRHRELLASADLLVTLEDRNLYRRVVGDLPACRKIAIASDGEKVRKNDYLSSDDLLIEGHVVDSLQALAALLPGDGAANDSVPIGVPDPPSRDGDDAAQFRGRRLGAAIVRGMARALGTHASPALVDDGQMFGGMIADAYDELPGGMRVFGDHGGFVGGGSSYATGLAIGEPSVRVLCTLGDQGLTNGLRGLVAASQERAPIVYLVCNNGRSVSLLKQARAARSRWLDDGREPYLDNPPGVNYVAVAKGLGLSASCVECGDELTEDAIDDAARRLEALLTEAFESREPTLIELRLPANEDVWAGIWITEGYEEQSQPDGRPH